tara:strand:- start:3149 stop:3343 length:195 start_codon:yes stop_codon:yes gene_type:complete
MGRKKIYTNLTDDELKQQRKLYMKKYYMKKKHNMIDGEYVKPTPREPKVCPLKITRGSFTICFD